MDEKYANIWSSGGKVELIDRLASIDTKLEAARILGKDEFDGESVKALEEERQAIQEDLAAYLEKVEKEFSQQ